MITVAAALIVSSAFASCVRIDHLSCLRYRHCLCSFNFRFGALLRHTFVVIPCSHGMLPLRQIIQKPPQLRYALVNRLVSSDLGLCLLWQVTHAIAGVSKLCPRTKLLYWLNMLHCLSIFSSYRCVESSKIQ